MRACGRLGRQVLPPTLRARLETPQTLASTSKLASGSGSGSQAQAQAHGREIQDQDGQEQIFKGWLKSVRAHKNVVFAEVTDGSTSEGLQAVFKGESRAEGLDAGASVRLRGKLVPSRGAGQSREFLVQETEIIGSCDPESYPIQKKHLPAPVLREMAHLRFRTTQTAAVMRVRDGMMRDFHDWFEENEFIHVHTPLLTSSDCEGAGETFGITTTPAPTLNNTTSDSNVSLLSDDPSTSSLGGTNTAPTPSTSASTSTPASTHAPEPFFPRPVNLTVSSQLHLEAPTHSLSRTYTLSPSFRAEPSQTSRHLSEFYMLEGEVVLDTLDELMDVVENGIRGVLGRMMRSEERRHVGLRRDLGKLYLYDTEESPSPSPDRVDRMSEIQRMVSAESESKFHRMTYTQAINEITNQHHKTPFEIKPEWNEGLASVHEKYLAGKYGPTFVTHYPKHLKPFYMLPSTADPSFHLTSDSPSTPHTEEPTETETKTKTETEMETETVACFDLLFPSVGELAGGSLREHRLPHLLSALQAHGLDQDRYKWYTDLRRYGSVPHGGWGMGWDRWISWVTGLGNLRDVVAFPRWKGHCDY